MKRLVFVICLICLLTLAACTPPPAQTPVPPSPAVTAAPAGPSGTAGPVPADGARTTAGGGAVISARPQATPDDGLRFRVGEATPEAERPAPAAPVATVRPLPSADAQRVLDRLPPLQAQPGDSQTFARPAESLPAPRPGTTVEQPFPPAQSQPTPVTASGSLEVTRKSPDGNVELAPYVSVTFNQPMAPLATVDQLAQRDVPLRIEPSVPGQWRWLGTSTLLFVPAGDGKESRLPMATQYTATVPSGTKSMGGSSLASDLVWHFRTPPLTLGSSYPSGDQVRPDTLLVATFDQRIDPAALLRAVRVTAGTTTAGTRLATEAEIAADKNVRRLLDANPGRSIAFRTEQPLPSDAQVTVTLNAGAPSAEGPLLTEKAQAFSFRTYGALRVLEHRCSWNPQTCPPMSPWYIRFSNNLDEAAVQDGWVSVSPELPGADVQVRGNMILIQGRSKGRTSYEVTLASGIRDVFGQTLGSEQKLRFDVGVADAVLYGSDRSFAVLDPAGQPTFSVYSINVPRLKVQLSRVTPADWTAYGAWIENLSGRGTNGPLPGAPAWSGTIETKGKADELTETVIDLAPALKNQRGHVVLFVEAEGVAPSPNRAPCRCALPSGCRTAILRSMPSSTSPT